MNIIQTVKNLNKRQRILIEIIIVLLLVFLIDKALIQTLKKKFFNLNSQLKIEEARLERNIKVRNNIKQLSNDFKRTKDYFTTSNLNATELKANMLQELERIARLTRVSIVSISSDDKVGETEFTNVYSAELRVEGEFSNFLKFFNYLTSSALLLDYDKFTLVTTNDEGTKLRLDSVIKYSVFK